MNRLGLRRKSHILWNPRQLSQGSLYAWYDASILSTFTLVNSGGINYVSQWNSVLGGSRYFTQGTASRRPYYTTSSFSKKPCVKFDTGASDTTSDYMDGFQLGNFNDTNTNLNMFVACRQTGVTIRGVTGDTTENYMGIFIFEGYPGGIFLASNTSGIQTGTLVGWWSNDLSTQLSRQITINNLYRNLTCFGGTVHGGNSGTWWVTNYPADYIRQSSTGTSGLNRRQYPYVNCRLGCALAGGGAYAYPLNGEIYELLLITGTLTDNVKIKILEYLNAKWGP